MCSEKLRVLLIEDDDADALQLRRALCRSSLEFDVTRASCLTAAVEALESGEFDVAVLDLNLPDGFGLENLETIQETAPQMPVVILTGDDDDAIAIESVRAGAQDFLSKHQLNEQIAVKSLTYAIQRKLTEVRLRQGVNELTEAAQVDSLTGLLNRRAFFSQASQRFAQAQADGESICCVMLDIDLFKRINDIHGHAAGDEALSAVARTLIEQSRSTDLVGRYGGEEFCALLPGIDETAAVQWAERVRLAVRDRVVETPRATISLTASLGVAVGPGVCERIEDLVDQADQALLVSKQRGRNLTTSFTTIDEAGGDESLPGEERPGFQDAAVSDYMTSPICCLKTDDSIAVAAQQLLSLGVNSLPVVDGCEQLVGIVSEKDLLEVNPTAHSWSTTIASVMNTTVVSFSQDAPLESVRDFLARVAMRRIVVVDEQRPVGVLSRSDLLRHQLEWAASLAPAGPIAAESNSH